MRYPIPGSRAFTADQLIDDITAMVKTTGGASLSLRDGSRPSGGFMVSLPHTEHTTLTSHFLLYPRSTLMAYIHTHAREIDRARRSMNDNTLYLGVWVDGHTTYIDLSERIEDRDLALDVALQREQVAIFDVDSQQAIRLNDEQAAREALASRKRTRCSACADVV